MKSSCCRNLSPFSLLACVMLASVPAHAAVVLNSLPAPVVTDHAASFSQSVNLSTGLDWIKYQGNTALTEKTGTNYLTASSVGSTANGSYPAPAGYEFSWSGGTPDASGSANKIHTNATFPATGLNSDGGWAVEATGLTALSAGQFYRLELWAVRTDGTPFSINAYDGATLLNRQTVNGASSIGRPPGSVSTDAIYSMIDFNVSGTSDALNVSFVRDITNGQTGDAANNRILAIGAWRLTTIPEPSSALLGALGTLILIRRRRI